MTDPTTNSKEELKSLEKIVQAISDGTYWNGKNIRSGLDELGIIVRYNELKESFSHSIDE